MIFHFDSQQSRSIKLVLFRNSYHHHSFILSMKFISAFFNNAFSNFFVVTMLNQIGSLNTVLQLVDMSQAIITAIFSFVNSKCLPSELVIRIETLLATLFLYYLLWILLHSIHIHPKSPFSSYRLGLSKAFAELLKFLMQRSVEI